MQELGYSNSLEVPTLCGKNRVGDMAPVNYRFVDENNIGDLRSEILQGYCRLFVLKARLDKFVSV
ncbi:hypothetical protein ColKHC_13527 [Colletotrichum higginsianum]|nr:hypothetical protein ColKHC_13527 [Colletotrichum higginsianum]